MNSYTFDFVSRWRVPAPLVDIWNTVGKVTEYPNWWPGIESVDLLHGPELPISLGARAKYTVASPLYRLHYETELIEFEMGKLIVAKATGDLHGVGTWTFSEKGNETEAMFEWKVEVTPPLLKLVSHVPPARGVMRFFHNQLMDAGERGLRKLFEKEMQEEMAS